MTTFLIEYQIEVIGVIEVDAASQDEAYSKYNEISWQSLIDNGEKSEQFDIYEQNDEDD